MLNSFKKIFRRYKRKLIYAVGAITLTAYFVSIFKEFLSVWGF